MRTKLAILLALLSLSTFLAACGDDEEPTDASASEEVVEDEEAAGGDTLTKEEFIAEGDAICAGLTEAGEQVEAPETEDDLARYLTELLDQAEAARDEFAALNPPEDGEEVHHELLDALETSMSTVEGAIAAAEDGDTVTVEDLLSQATEEGAAADEAAQEYGFEECGSTDDDAESEGASRSGGGAVG